MNEIEGKKKKTSLWLHFTYPHAPYEWMEGGILAFLECHMLHAKKSPRAHVPWLEPGISNQHCFFARGVEF